MLPSRVHSVIVQAERTSQAASRSIDRVNTGSQLWYIILYQSALTEAHSMYSNCECVLIWFRRCPTKDQNLCHLVSSVVSRWGAWTIVPSVCLWHPPISARASQIHNRLLCDYTDSFEERGVKHVAVNSHFCPLPHKHTQYFSTFTFSRSSMFLCFSIVHASFVCCCLLFCFEFVLVFDRRD